MPSNATAPRPGAILLGSTDISSASGLEPGSLERALAAPVSPRATARLSAPAEPLGGVLGAVVSAELVLGRRL